MSENELKKHLMETHAVDLSDAVLRPSKSTGSTATKRALSTKDSNAKATSDSLPVERSKKKSCRMLKKSELSPKFVVDSDQENVDA